jgi:hypothetical protein
LAREIEERGHLEHWYAVAHITKIFGKGFDYSEPEYDRRGHVTGSRRLLHPEILLALKKLAGEKINWGKECREWHAKGAKPKRPPRVESLITALRKSVVTTT